MYNFIQYFISTDKSESNMKLLVTGGLGFIGSNFIIKLLKEKNDFEITNVDAELPGSDKRKKYNK